MPAQQPVQLKRTTNPSKKSQGCCHLQTKEGGEGGQIHEKWSVKYIMEKATLLRIICGYCTLSF